MTYFLSQTEHVHCFPTGGRRKKILLATGPRDKYCIVTTSQQVEQCHVGNLGSSKTGKSKGSPETKSSYCLWIPFFKGLTCMNQLMSLHCISLTKCLATELTHEIFDSCMKSTFDTRVKTVKGIWDNSKSHITNKQGNQTSRSTTASLVNFYPNHAITSVRKLIQEELMWETKFWNGK